jgi:hypothetical protein
LKKELQEAAVFLRPSRDGIRGAKALAGDRFVMSKDVGGTPGGVSRPEEARNAEDGGGGEIEVEMQVEYRRRTSGCTPQS